VSEDLAVPFGRPRDYASVIFEPEYVALKRRILDVIRRETMRGLAGDAPPDAATANG
jgi:hypothetical protein